jgi:hypothetical protein
VRGEHEARRGRRDRGAKIPAHADTVAIGQAHIEDGDVREQLGNLRQGLRGGGRLAHDGDVVLGSQEVREASPDDLVVVEQEHRDHHGRLDPMGA